MISFTEYGNRFSDLSQNSASTNVTRGLQLVNDSLRYLTTKYFFDETSYVVPGGSVSLQQGYNLPYNIKSLINCTVLVGNVLYQPLESNSRQFWDSINTIPFYSDFPQFFYRYNNQLLLFPIPASNGNVININFKRRLQNLSQADYVTGTVSVTTATTTVTGAGTSWTASMAGRWIQITENSTSNTTTGDQEWYQIASVTNSTTLVLLNPYQGTTVTGGSYTIGEMALLPEDYQDLPLYRSLEIYFTSIVPNPAQASLYKQLYDTGFEKLDEEFGSKTTSPVLTSMDAPVYNPNLFPRAS